MKKVKNILFAFTTFFSPNTEDNTASPGRRTAKTSNKGYESLAYLAFKNRKQKGLLAADSGCPTVYFGDEWTF